MEKLLFREEQKFSKQWIWLMLLLVFAVSVVPLWYGLIYQVTTGQSWGDKPIGNGVLALLASLVTLLMTGILVLFKNIHLQVEIRRNEICFRYPPFIRRWRRIASTDIERYEVGKYRPVAEYGGWGVRQGSKKHGKAYNLTGNIGLKLFLKNGEIILLGSQRAQAVSYAMKKLMSRDAYTDKI
ncbi:MAG: hypothetical protein AMS27_06995 [Bacteroides sp. SM23_62_1]|nr:MAG: hypothetical protein AMS27_06995 [Bacteroides sp. SM23_62_1]